MCLDRWGFVTFPRYQKSSGAFPVSTAVGGRGRGGGRRGAGVEERSSRVNLVRKGAGRLGLGSRGPGRRPALLGSGAPEERGRARRRCGGGVSGRPGGRGSRPSTGVERARNRPSRGCRGGRRARVPASRRRAGAAGRRRAKTPARKEPAPKGPRLPTLRPP